MITGRRIDLSNINSSKNLNLKFLFTSKDGILKTKPLDNWHCNYILEWNKLDSSKVNSPNSIADTLGWIIYDDIDLQKLNNEQFFEIL